MLIKKFGISTLFLLAFYNLNVIYYTKIICENPYINIYLLIKFILITGSSQFLRGSTYRNNKLISKFTYKFSKTIFLLLLFNSTLFSLSDYYYLLFIFYLPIYLDGAEYTGSYKLKSNNYFFTFLHKLFSFYKFQLINELSSDDKKKLKLILAHPHGLFPFGALNNILCKQSTELSNLNLDNTYSAGASFSFFFPIIRELYLFMGMIDCSKSIVEKFLVKNKSISLVPGGAQEASYSTYKKSVLIMKKRKGIFELAFKYGLSLIPVYTFGENELFEHYDNNYLIMFKYITGLLIPIGYFTFNKIEYITIIGKSINVEKKTDYTIEDIDNLRELYIKELTNLYDKYKHLNKNYKNTNLQII